MSKKLRGIVVGADGERPVSPDEGEFFLNTDTGQLEIYDDVLTTWRIVGGVGSSSAAASISVAEFTGDGILDTFNTSFSAGLAQSVLVFVDAAFQGVSGGGSWTATSIDPVSVQFTSPPPDTSEIVVIAIATAADPGSGNKDTFVTTAGQASTGIYDLTFVVNDENEILVAVDNILQLQTTDGWSLSGNNPGQVTFSPTLLEGQRVDVLHRKGAKGDPGGLVGESTNNFDATGGQTVFNLDFEAGSANEIHVFVDAALQTREGVDYTLTPGNPASISFSPGLLAGQRVDVYRRGGGEGPEGPAGPSEFPSGTRMLFQQAAAPTGWTRETINDDYALRLVDGDSGVPGGGSIAFSGALATPGVTGTVDPHTLTIAEMPAHTHGMLYNDGTVDASSNLRIENVTDTGIVNEDTQSEGGDGSHTHGLSSANANINVRYVDVILAVKD